MTSPFSSSHLQNILLRTTDLHDHFTDKSVFVAGSTGFFGRWFMAFFDYLRDQGVNVVVHGGSLRSTGLDVCNWRTYPRDLLDADFIINCAGDAGGGDLLTHALSGVGLYERMKPSATLLHFSSGAVSLDDWTDYATAKAIGESKLEIREGVQIVRPFATVGPGFSRESHFAIPTFLRRASMNLPLEVAPNVTRSFAHICDLVVQCLHVMVNGDGMLYEVGSDDEITMEEAARLISDDVKVVEREYPTTSAAKYYKADLSRVRNHFNLDLDWNSVQAVLDTKNYFLSQ